MVFACSFYITKCLTLKFSIKKKTWIFLTRWSCVVALVSIRTIWPTRISPKARHQHKMNQLKRNQASCYGRLGYNARENFVQPVYQSQRAVLHSSENLIKRHEESQDEGKSFLCPSLLDPKAITATQNSWFRQHPRLYFFPGITYSTAQICVEMFNSSVSSCSVVRFHIVYSIFMVPFDKMWHNPQNFHCFPPSCSCCLLLIAVSPCKSELGVIIPWLWRQNQIESSRNNNACCLTARASIIFLQREEMRWWKVWVKLSKPSSVSELR